MFSLFYFCLSMCMCVLFLLVISPELVLEVEARMRRNYLPTSLLPTRKHSRHAVKPHLPTVQEMQGKMHDSTSMVMFIFLLTYASCSVNSLNLSCVYNSCFINFLFEKKKISNLNLITF